MEIAAGRVALETSNFPRPSGRTWNMGKATSSTQKAELAQTHARRSLGVARTM